MKTSIWSPLLNIGGNARKRMFIVSMTKNDKGLVRKVENVSK